MRGSGYTHPCDRNSAWCAYHARLPLKMLFLILHPLTGMVETEFSIVRYRGDKSAADKVYDGLQPCMRLLASVDCPLTVP